MSPIKPRVPRYNIEDFSPAAAQPDYLWAVVRGVVTGR
jgi:hypothetical protein